MARMAHGMDGMDGMHGMHGKVACGSFAGAAFGRG